MSGTPTEAEIRTQWKNAIVLIEKLRDIADDTIVGAGHAMDVLAQSLEGEYTVSGLSAAANRFRASLATLCDNSRAREILDPVLYEYARFIGNPYTSPSEIAFRLRRYFAENSQSVTSRGITYASSGTASGSNVGNGVLLRLTKDQFGFNNEGVTVEAKTMRCIQDTGSGARAHAEAFVVEGETASYDSLGWDSSGSGIQRLTLRALHCGSGEGGSLLRNASFSVYDSAATPKFDGWTQTSGGASVTQDTATYYRSFPGATTDASLRITGGGGLVTLRQPLADMRTSRISSDTPYVLSVMVNKTVGTAVGGTFTVRLGGVSVDTAISAIGSGWQRITIPLTEDCWSETFNDSDIDVELEWSTSTSGYLLVDDVIFAPMTFVDGTYFALIGGTTPFQVQDYFTVTDTGGAAGTGILNYWLWRAGYSTLPASGSPTFTDPTIP